MQKLNIFLASLLLTFAGVNPAAAEDFDPIADLYSEEVLLGLDLPDLEDEEVFLANDLLEEATETTSSVNTNTSTPATNTLEADDGGYLEAEVATPISNTTIPNIPPFTNITITPAVNTTTSPNTVIENQTSDAVYKFSYASYLGNTKPAAKKQLAQTGPAAENLAIVFGLLVITYCAKRKQLKFHV